MKMITLKKIKTLKPRVQLRKCAGQAYLASKGEIFESEYILGLKDIALSLDFVSDKEYFEKAFLELAAGNLKRGEDIYYKSLAILGEEVADWDIIDSDNKLDNSIRKVMPRYLLLDRIRSPYNIGAIFRSAESFGIKHIYLYECGDVNSPRAIRTSRGAIDVVEHSIINSLDEVKGPFFALELGGKDIKEFSFPAEGTCILGSEESGVSPECLELAKSSLGKVEIPLHGAKGSINVSVAAGILMYSWDQFPFPLS